MNRNNRQTIRLTEAEACGAIANVLMKHDWAKESISIVAYRICQSLGFVIHEVDGSVLKKL